MAPNRAGLVPNGGDSVQVAELIDCFISELEAPGAAGLNGAKIRSSPTVQRILALPGDERVSVLLELISRQTAQMREFGVTTRFSWNLSEGLKNLISALVKKSLPFKAETIDRLIHLMSQGQGFYSWQLSLGGLVRVLETFCDEHGVPDQLRPKLVALRNAWDAQSPYADVRTAVKRLDQLLAPAPGAAPDTLLTTDEAWTGYLRAQIDRLKTARPAWHALLLHCNTAVTSKPSRKWLARAESLVEEIGASAFAAVLRGTLAEIGKPGGTHFQQFYDRSIELDLTLIHDKHSDLLRGLVWCASFAKEDSSIIAVGDAAAACFKKIPNVGPRAPKIGNACLYALSANSSLAAVGQLSRIKTQAKHTSIRQQLTKALDRAADKTGMTAAEMEEVAVPSCGLTDVGTIRTQLGDITAVLECADGSKPQLSWLRADGKTLKSAPASLKETFAADLRSLKQSEKEIAKLLPAQRDRIERLFLQERSWSVPEFRSRYLDHPLVGILARRLIWCYSDGNNTVAGIWLNGQIVDQQDRVVPWLGSDTRVTPWHPSTRSAEEVRSWREWLVRHQVRQPFKQAHREIYILTDAERNTETYSNRFAAHILRQHQFSALCQQRGWRYSLQGNWDSHNIPTLQLPQWRLRVEFWVEPLSDAGTSGSGIYVHVSTDQVCFYHGGAADPMPLADVSPIVLSEVLRDVDLFVGVASVGNDPNWIDNALAVGHRGYWDSYSFGDLSATAQTRKSVLDRIVPRLKIAERCSLSDKFLVVRGDLRTYKIHLGSGNILMSPNDQYLCIVPKPAQAGVGGHVFLPFEGDNLLSVILSKAFLLADDRKIKDPTIVRQIERL